MLKEFASVTQVYLVTGYTDLRRGIDGLAEVVQGKQSLDPYSTSLFLFCGRRRDRLKGLLWEGDGFLLLYKRLDNGAFRWPRNETEAKLLTEQEIDVRLVLAENAALKNENVVLKDENAELKEQLAYLKKVVYGQKSEKTEVVLEGAEQISMVDEAEQASDIHPKTLQTTEVKAYTRAKRTRDEIMADLPEEEVFHEVTDKTCDKCGSEMTVIGKEKIRDELVYVPARLFLRRHVAEVVKCISCGMDESRDAELSDIEKSHIRTAEVLTPMIPHSFCSPELLAHIVYEKYCNAMPLYRLEKDFAAKGANISRTTMANWIIMAAQLWVKPAWEQMHKELVTSSVIHADETVVQVLNEPGKKATTDSRMWVYCNGKINDHSNIL